MIPLDTQLREYGGYFASVIPVVDPVDVINNGDTDRVGRVPAQLLSSDTRTRSRSRWPRTWIAVVAFGAGLLAWLALRLS